jgi:putative copper resistance protein D
MTRKKAIPGREREKLAVATALVLACTMHAGTALLFAQQLDGRSGSAGPGAANHAHGHADMAEPKWEGSPAGIAYSEFNHRLAAAFVLLIGLSELRSLLAATRLVWARFLLPVAMLGAGGFLLIWSDHDAWPIGSLGFAETFVGNDMEIVQHKLYGVLLLTVGAIEVARRAGRLPQAIWRLALPMLAFFGGAMLFTHLHGAHPGAQKIATHHNVMGTLAMVGGACKLLGEWVTRPAHASARGGADVRRKGSSWELAWAALVLVIGAQLLVYSE